MCLEDSSCMLKHFWTFNDDFVKYRVVESSCLLVVKKNILHNRNWLLCWANINFRFLKMLGITSCLFQRSLTMCSSRNYPYPTQGRFMKNSKAEQGSKQENHPWEGYEDSEQLQNNPPLTPSLNLLLPWSVVRSQLARLYACTKC